MNQTKLLLVVMDGVGERSERYGNAVQLARTPNLHWLRKNALFRTLQAHGTAVGLPSDADMGNSEVGHNALGAGRVFDQGAKLVQNAIDDGSMFRGQCWQNVVSHVIKTKGTLHFIGLLSDGNVHSHENHLFAMLRQAKQEGIQRVRIHPLFDGRDVGERSAEIYVARLNQVMTDLRSATFDVEVASGGGRMTVTMDRYEADWGIVARGWRAHVLGQARTFGSIDEALAAFRQEPALTDQYIPEYVIARNGKPVGTIEDGDSVVLFNFRGDRAIELSRAFSESSFTPFDRQRYPKVFFAGMMQYDGDLKIPANFLVSPPVINETLSDQLISNKVYQFACSETQKFGHVTYFWNGNRSGYIAKELEEYLEIPSDDHITFDEKPWMKAYEITRATIERMQKGAFQFGRINFANGDMVGHTGDLDASVIAVATVDLMIGRLVQACNSTGTTLIVTADHGNCDEMFDVKPGTVGAPGWEDTLRDDRPKPKTSHSLSPVPFYFYTPNKPSAFALTAQPRGTLANMASTVTAALGVSSNPNWLPSLIKRT